MRFGDIQALDNVGLTVVAGSVYAVIGPNGVGKSSLLNCISRLYKHALQADSAESGR